MKPDKNLRVLITESQAVLLQERLKNAGMKLQYQEEQHGSCLVVSIGCAQSQERTIREIVREVGASLMNGENELDLN
jgi:hypothetical protein